MVSAKIQTVSKSSLKNTSFEKILKFARGVVKCIYSRHIGHRFICPYACTLLRSSASIGRFSRRSLNTLIIESVVDGQSIRGASSKIVDCNAILDNDLYVQCTGKPLKFRSYIAFDDFSGNLLDTCRFIIIMSAADWIWILEEFSSAAVFDMILI